MTLFRIEALTILSVAVIGVILAIYVIMLKRNGWLGRTELLYRCPNPQCRKVFRKPSTIKDLSAPQERTYQGCPECGADLGQYPASEQSPETATKLECKYYFGYLGNHDKQQAIPETCLKCSSSLECMLYDKSKNPISERAKALVQKSILRYI